MQKTAYEIFTRLEFRRVLFRSPAGAPPHPLARPSTGPPRPAPPGRCHPRRVSPWSRPVTPGPGHGRYPGRRCSRPASRPQAGAPGCWPLPASLPAAPPRRPPTARPPSTAWSATARPTPAPAPPPVRGAPPPRTRSRCTTTRSARPRRTRPDGSPGIASARSAYPAPPPGASARNLKNAGLDRLLAVEAVLLEGLGERAVPLVVDRDEVDPVPVGRVHRRLQRLLTGIVDRSGDQTFRVAVVRVGGVGQVLRGHLRGRLGGQAVELEPVVDRHVELQATGAAQLGERTVDPVVGHPGDLAHVLRYARLGLRQRGDDQRLIRGDATPLVLHRLDEADLLGHGQELRHHGLQHLLRGGLGRELVGGREQETLDRGLRHLLA